ncbi:hypothetical protein M011DRAFT_454693 [Sporormia fimetaria CBS 119925]|uniref:BTB domain-containing protein n=1 Tax=Sporormia fimetaria CBS 119925 TaxID=1340428 RepID=A0A6A6VPS3_9PLEO|nr:hypothetical protein M011DRAFT_454693 [Sporormia fimetaria CBS 119925]
MAKYNHGATETGYLALHRPEQDALKPSAPTPDATSYWRTPPVHVVVGKGDAKKDFYIHQGLICGRSRFFKNALSGDRAETAQEVKLPEDNPGTFSLYQQFLYTDALPHEEVRDSTYVTFCKVYVLCDKLLDPVGKSKVLWKIMKLCTTAVDGRYRFPGHQSLRVLYEGTTENDSIRRLLADVYATHGDESTAVVLTTDPVHIDFFCDLSRSMAVHIQERKAKLVAQTREIEKITAELDEQKQALEMTRAELVESRAHGTKASGFARTIKNRLSQHANRRKAHDFLQLHPNQVNNWPAHIGTYE